MKTKKKFPFLNYIQYFIALIITILFLIGFIPFSFDNLFNLIVGLIIIQAIISILRGRIFNVIIELILLFLAIFSVIPILGYVFRFFGFVLGILEIISFKSTTLYTKVKFNNFKSKPFKKKQIKKEINFQDAEFKEK